VRRVLGRVELARGPRRVVNEVAEGPHLVVARGAPVHGVRILQEHFHVGAVHDGIRVARVGALDAGRHVAVVFHAIHEEPVFVVGWNFLAVHGTTLVMQIRGHPVRRSRHPLVRSADYSKRANVVIHLIGCCWRWLQSLVELHLYGLKNITHMY